MTNRHLTWFLFGSLLSSGSASAYFAPEGAYKVGRRDVLKITVPGNPEFSLESTISEKGTLNYPILGELEVQGLTVSEIADKIRAGLVEGKLLVQPTVSVEVKEYLSQQVTVLGEVKTTGKYPLKGSERLLDVIAEAGGLTAQAGEIQISRATVGEARNIVIKSSEILTDTVRNNPLLVSGDVIFVRPREISQIFVSGEIANEKAIEYVEGMTVYQAIVMAGGLTRFGSKSKVRIKRSAGGKEEIVSVNLSDIEKGKEKDMLLLPNDQIIVGRRIF